MCDEMRESGMCDEMMESGMYDGMCDERPYELNAPHVWETGGRDSASMEMVSRWGGGGGAGGGGRDKRGSRGRRWGEQSGFRLRGARLRGGLR